MNQESTISDVLEAVNTLSTHMDQKFAGIDQKFAKIEATMVTKDYLDEKLGDLRGDLTVLMRKEDHKLHELIGILETKQVLTPAEVKHLFSLEPFPMLSL
mgnify:CR=1 FL=1